MTNPLTNDPFYRRVKDALLIILAIATILPGLKDFVFGSKESEDPASILVLKVSLDDVKSRLTRLEDKIDRMSYWQRRNGRND